MLWRRVVNPAGSGLLGFWLRFFICIFCARLAVEVPFPRFAVSNPLTWYLWVLCVLCGKPLSGLFSRLPGISWLNNPRLPLFSFSHLTTHHPVRNCQRSSDSPVRVPMAYAIGRFSDIARPPGGRLKMGHGVSFPPAPSA